MLASIVGWCVYVILLLYIVSGVFYVRNAAMTGGGVSRMGLAQWGSAILLALVFGFTGLNKLHLFWCIPVAFVLSWTPIGIALGSMIGYLTAFLFMPRQ